MNASHDSAKQIPVEAFANLGNGRLTYVRALSSDEATSLFPRVPPLAPGLKLWALLSADGTPILLTDSREAAVAGAVENDLVPVAVH